MASPFLIFPNGWEKSAERPSATYIIRETGAALARRLRELRLTWDSILDSMNFGNFGRKSRGSCACPSAIRMKRRNQRSPREDNRVAQDGQNGAIRFGGIKIRRPKRTPLIF